MDLPQLSVLSAPSQQSYLTYEDEPQAPRATQRPSDTFAWRAPGSDHQTSCQRPRRRSRGPNAADPFATMASGLWRVLQVTPPRHARLSRNSAGSPTTSNWTPTSSGDSFFGCVPNLSEIKAPRPML